MKKIKNFDAFNESENLNNPVKEEQAEKKLILSSNSHKAEFFSHLKKDQKAVIMGLKGKVVDAMKDPKDPDYYIIKTGVESFPECKVPKRLIYES
jgi:6-phosphogluconate dehydrogenase